jgi:hypothetical protein
MNYIIGSGFSGLTAAYALHEKGIKSTIISPADKIKRKNKSLLSLIFKKDGEILNNSQTLTNVIKKMNKSHVRNCKYLISHLDGGQSNFWGGVVGNINDYNLKNYSLKKEEFLKNSQTFKKLLKLIGISSKNFFIENNKKNPFFSEKNYDVSKKNVSNLKRFLKMKKIIFLNNNFVKKVDSKNSTIEVYDILKKKDKKIKFKNLFISCGPVETSKLILNSFKDIRKIHLKETQHFYALIRLKKEIKTRFFKINLNKINFSCQLYSLKNVLGLFFKNYFKNTEYKKKGRYFVAQCYLNQNNSGKIEISKKKNQINILGIKNKNFNERKLIKEINIFNKKNDFLEIKKVFFNQIGASNHLGASLPMTNNKFLSLGVNKYGKLNNTKNIFVADSSILNEIDTSPITIFSLNNILRMILDNKYHKNNS